MNAAVAARVRQLEAERDYRCSVAEFRRRRRDDQDARIRALLSEVIAALASLPLEQEAWPNQHTKRRVA